MRRASTRWRGRCWRRWRGRDLNEALLFSPACGGSAAKRRGGTGRALIRKPGRGAIPSPDLRTVRAVDRSPGSFFGGLTPRKRGRKSTAQLRFPGASRGPVSAACLDPGFRRENARREAGVDEMPDFSLPRRCAPDPPPNLTAAHFRKRSGGSRPPRMRLAEDSASGLGVCVDQANLLVFPGGAADPGPI